MNGMREARERWGPTWRMFKDGRGGGVYQGGLGFSNWKNRQGEWEATEENFALSSAADFAFEVTRGPFRAYLANNAAAPWPVTFGLHDGTRLRTKLHSVGYLDIETKEWRILQSAQPVSAVGHGNNVTYFGLFDGVDLGISYHPRRLKEEIRVTAAARANIPSPPAGINTAGALLVFATKLDLDGVPDNLVDGGNRIRDASEWEGEGPLHFVNLQGIRYALPMGNAWIEGVEDSAAPVWRRLVHTAAGHFLLTGIPFSDVKEMPAGDLIIDPTFEEQPTPGDDTWINNKSGQLDFNYGAATQIKIGGYAAVYGTEHALIRFDWSSIGEGQQCDSATLDLYLDSRTGNVAADDDLFRQKRAWVKGTGNGSATADGATWNKYDSTNTWSTAGGAAHTDDYYSTQTSTLAFASDEADGHKVWTLTPADITEMLPGGAVTNQGFVMRQDAAVNTSHGFASGDNVTADKRPKITINYSVDGGGNGGAVAGGGPSFF
ncbi:hypothetical protein LCGC14_0916740 [marine sediment metagenome]|uniref:Uncharacterized protein n=1 Tax=marine sediment metagenome TaxID=412755 RepID=A0A0F9NS46_9ZZZZ